MLKRVLDYWSYREMLINLVLKELRARYKGSVLGFLWSFFNPLLMLIVYSVVFSYIMRTNVPNYPMFVFVALLPWNFFANSLLQGSVSLVQNSALIKKVYFPREILPSASVLANAVNYVLSLLILIPALILFHIKLTWAISAFPFVLLVQTILVLGLGVLVSVLNVYFRDLEHILGVLVSVWFFLTPVIYPIDLIPEKVKVYFIYNPMTPVIEAYRNIFFNGLWPNWRDMALLLIFSTILLLVSLLVFNRLQRNVAEEL